MGRAAKYTDEEILDGALDLVFDGGPDAARMTAIAKRLGAPSGSIYHRFASRDLLLAALWIRTVKRFQRGFLDAFEADEPLRAAHEAVTHTLDWCGAHAKEAKMLSMYRRADLLAQWPDELGEDLATLNDDVKRAIRRFVVAHFGVVNATTVTRAQFALIEIPYAAVRHMFHAPADAAQLRKSAVAAAMAVLNTGDTDA